MNSARAHGFLIAGMINEHLWPKIDQEDMEYYQLEQASAYCPRCCGPCAALEYYFNTNRGRAEADAYAMALPKSPQSDSGYDWQLPNGAIDWAMIDELRKLGWCPNHDDALHQQGQAREKFHD